MLSAIREEIICPICRCYFNDEKRSPIACSRSHSICLKCIKSHDKATRTGNLDIQGRRRCFICKTKYLHKPSYATRMHALATISVNFRKYWKANNSERNRNKREVRRLQAKVAKQEKQLGNCGKLGPINEMEGSKMYYNSTRV